MVEKLLPDQKVDINHELAEIRQQLSPQDLQFIRDQEKELEKGIEAEQGVNKKNYLACDEFVEKISEWLAGQTPKLPLEWLLAATVSSQNLAYVLPLVHMSRIVHPDAKSLGLTAHLLTKLTQPDVKIDTVQFDSLLKLSSRMTSQIENIYPQKGQKVEGDLVSNLTSNLTEYLPQLFEQINLDSANSQNQEYENMFTISANGWVISTLYEISSRNPANGTQLIDAALTAIAKLPNLPKSPSTMILQAELAFLRRCVVQLSEQKLAPENFPTLKEIHSLIQVLKGITFKHENTIIKTTDTADENYRFSGRGRRFLGSGLDVTISGHEAEPIAHESLPTRAAAKLNQLAQDHPEQASAKIDFTPFGFKAELNMANPAQAAFIPAIVARSMTDFKDFMIQYHQKRLEDPELPECGLVYGVTNPRMADFAVENLGMTKLPDPLSKVKAILARKDVKQVPVVVYSTLREMESAYVFQVSPLAALAGIFRDSDPAESFTEMDGEKKRLVELRKTLEIELSKTSADTKLATISIIESKLRKSSPKEKKVIQSKIAQEQSRHPQMNRLELAYIVAVAHFNPKIETEIDKILATIQKVKTTPAAA